MYSANRIDIPRTLPSNQNLSNEIPKDVVNRANSFSNIIQRTSEKLIVMEAERGKSNNFVRPIFAAQETERTLRVDAETKEHIEKANVKLSEYLYLLSNEPSIGMLLCAK
jgi:hypothetical protein